MVTPAQLDSWSPQRLRDISDDVAAHRRTLLYQSDDLASGKVPTSWTFDSAQAAIAAHQRLADALAIQIAEAATVITALDTAADAISAAQQNLSGARYAASRHELHIDDTTGAVRMTRSYETTADVAYAATQANYVRTQVQDALRAAAAADEALAAVLRTAATTDTNTVGTLDQQREILDFLALSTKDQVDYLLAHPEAYALLGDHASDQVKEMVGQRVAAEIDAVARDATLMLDPERIDRCGTLVAAFGHDSTVMAAMYERIEPAGVLGLFNSISVAIGGSGDPESIIRFADDLRTGLQSATQNPDFDGEAYGREMVRYATYQAPPEDIAQHDSTYPYANLGNAGVLDYLLRDGEYSESFTRGVVWELDAFDRRFPAGSTDWAHYNSIQSSLNGLDDTAFPYQPDPMARAMGQLGNHPQLGLEFFTESGAGQERSDFYFAERDWSRDGFAGISEAALAIGTDPQNLTASSAATGRFVSEFFDRLPDNPQFNATDAAGAAEPVADLLKHYMPAVELAIDSSVDVPADIRNFRNDYLPDLTDYPMLDKPDLDRLLQVALSTEDGMARIAEGVAGFRQEQLNAFAAQHPAGATTHAGALQELINRSAIVEGYMQHAVGDIAIAGAVSRDQQVAVFTGLVSEAVGLIPVPGADALGDVVGGVAKDAWGAAWNRVAEIPSDTITEAFGSYEDAARNAATGEAMLGQEKMVINTYLSLVRAGIVDLPADMSGTWAPGGNLITLGDLSPAEIPRFRADAWEELNGDPVGGTQINLAYKDPFNGWDDR